MSLMPDLTQGSDPEFTARLKAAAARGPTEDELYQQMLSFVADSVSTRERKVSKEEVEKILNKQRRRAE